MTDLIDFAFVVGILIFLIVPAWIAVRAFEFSARSLIHSDDANDDDSPRTWLQRLGTAIGVVLVVVWVIAGSVIGAHKRGDN